MRRARLWVCCALSVHAIALADSIETVRNPSFEKRGASIHPWRGEIWEGKAEISVDGNEARSGKQSLRLTGIDKGLAVVQQRVKRLADARGATITLCGWWHGEDVKGTGGRVVLRFLRANGQKAREDEAPIVASGSFDWKQFSVTARVPADTTAFDVFLELWRSEGTIRFDDISLQQDVPTVDVSKIRTGTGAPPPIRVAVYDADSAGGQSYGETGILAALAKAEGIAATRITQLLVPVLFDYDVLILADVHSVGLTPLSDFAGSSIGIGTDWRANVRAFAAAGGGVLLTHDGVGGRLAFDPPLFPRISHSSAKVQSPRIARLTPHPVTDGIAPFVHAFPDHMTCKVGNGGTPILWDSGGDVVGVVSEAVGRVCAVGICIGLGPGDKEAEPEGAELQLLRNTIDWLAGGRGDDSILCVSPYVVQLNEMADDPTFTMTAIARGGAVGARKIKTRLANQAGKAVAEHSFAIAADGDGLSQAQWTVAVAELEDGIYRLLTDEPEPQLLATLKLALKWERLADSLPRAAFRWKSLNCHSPGGLRTPDDCIEMVRRTKAMGFDALLFDGKTPGGGLYYRSKVGRPVPITETFDPLGVTAEACRAVGIQCLVQFCSFSEGKQTIFFEEHPEWAAANLGETHDYLKQQSIFGCPDRPEVRAYELALIREILTEYPVDGLSFDYIRYKNDYACYCDYSQRTLREYMAAHAGLSEEEARTRRSRETIIGFTQDVRKLADEIRPGLILHGYTHPVWANEFPLQYHSQRASAHGKDPARGGGWTLETVFHKAKFNVDIARKVLDYPVAAPMADTAYTGWAKSPERFRRELRLIRHAGAEAVMVYLYSTLRAKPELRKLIAEEFGGDVEAAGE